MEFSLQPTLTFENIKLQPLKQDDFERLFAVASDPAIWKMHPNKERYKREVFEIFFKGAIESKGAFLITDQESDTILGSSRFYDYNEKDSTVLIGYTFYATRFWGTDTNSAVKKMMLDYIFQFVKKVIFHVGKDNLRSVKAMQKLGAVYVKEEEITYFGENSKMNIVFEIEKKNWLAK